MVTTFKTLGPCFLASPALFSRPLAPATPPWARHLGPWCGRGPFHGALCFGPSAQEDLLCLTSRPCHGLLPHPAEAAGLDSGGTGVPSLEAAGPSQQSLAASTPAVDTPQCPCLVHEPTPALDRQLPEESLRRSCLSLGSRALHTGPVQNRLSWGKSLPRRVGSSSENHLMFLVVIPDSTS